MAVIDSFAVFTRRSRFSILRQISKMIAVRRQRHELGAAPDYLLEDIGVTKAQAQAEAKRPVWDVPENWIDRRDTF